MQQNRPYSQLELSQILQNWVAGQLPTPAIKRQLATWILADQASAQAFGIKPDNVSQVIEARSQLLLAVYPALKQLCQDTLHLPVVPWETLWNLWIPLACQLAACRQVLQRPLIQGILGVQGTGKTTLATLLSLLLSHLGYRTLSFSLDDLYKTYTERQRLSIADPRLVWRGPPGTHDVDLGCRVLDEIRHAAPQAPVQVPRFDKSAINGAGDRTEPEIVEGVAIVLFEGWFVGVRPIDPAAFATAPPPIVTEADREFASEMNSKLQDYLPLWQRLDRLLVLYPTDYHLSQQWRRQAEQQMIASGKSGMSATEIDRFVEYFWKALHPELFVRPLLSDPQHTDLVVEVNRDRSIKAIYRPQDRL